MGRLTRDPELRRTGSGIAVASFTLAVDRDYKPDGGERECDFIDCVAWRNTGEFASRYFFKGKMAVVSGRLQVRSWTDKDGNKRRTAEVVVDNMYFGDSKKEPDTAGGDPGGYTHYGDGISEPPYSNYYQPPGGNPSGNFAELEDDAQLPF